MLYLTPPLFYDKDGKRNYGVVSQEGTFSQRPTGTYPYVVLYTATDRDGETYRLEANTDGSVSSNWVSIGSGGSGGTVLTVLNLLALLTKGITTITQGDDGFTLWGYAGLTFNNGDLLLEKYTNGASIKFPLKATGGIVAKVSDGQFIELSSELYLHRIYISDSGSALVRFELLTRSATQLTYTDIASLLNGKFNTATGYAGKDPSMPPDFGTSVYCVKANPGVIYAINQNGQTIELEQANVTITDTVEQI